jgi:hypothetical protein
VIKDQNGERLGNSVKGFAFCLGVNGEPGRDPTQGVPGPDLQNATITYSAVRWGGGSNQQVVTGMPSQ